MKASSTNAGYMPNVPENSPPSAAPRASITDQVEELIAFAVPSSPGAGDFGQYGGMRRVEKTAQRHLYCDKRIYQPNIAGIAHEQEAEDRCRPQQVGSDKDMLAFVAIGHNAGDGVNHKRRQHAHHEDGADRQPRLRQQPNQRSRRHQVEPVAEQTDDLSEPEIAVVAIFLRRAP